MGTLQILVLFLFLENHCKFEDENEDDEDRTPTVSGLTLVSDDERRSTV